MNNPPPLLRHLRENDLVERFQNFCTPDIRNLTVIRWLQKITGHIFSDYQITTTRKYLNCRPSRGGKRPVGDKKCNIVTKGVRGWRA